MTQDQIETSITVNYAKLLKKAETRKSTYNATIRNPELSPATENSKRKNENQGQNKKNKKAKKEK
ncbi:unnamed protein product [Rhizopus stolonifer]